jgi:hypothetical protein
MADRATRALRIKAHEEFDKLWRTGLMSRSKAYFWLASELEIASDQCHISWLTKEQLIKTARISFLYLKENEASLLRRKEKKEARLFKKFERELNEQRRNEQRKDVKESRRRRASNRKP